MRRRWFPLVGGVAAAGVAVLSARGRGKQLDRSLYRALNGTGGPVRDLFFKAITELGSIWASSAAASVMAARKRHREGMDALGAAVAMWALGQGLKRVVGRPRPYLALDDYRLLIAKPKGTTWPSSHPAVLLAFATVASRDLDVSPPAKAGLLATAAVVGISRVYLGVHFPADVAGGLLLGRAVADMWSAVVSPKLIGQLPSVASPLQ
jgi:membrane-associated phospholipid phosphatase